MSFSFAVAKTEGRPIDDFGIRLSFKHNNALFSLPLLHLAWSFCEFDFGTWHFVATVCKEFVVVEYS